MSSKEKCGCLREHAQFRAASSQADFLALGSLSSYMASAPLPSAWKSLWSRALFKQASDGSCHCLEMSYVLPSTFFPFSHLSHLTTLGTANSIGEHYHPLFIGGNRGSEKPRPQSYKQLTRTPKGTYFLSASFSLCPLGKCFTVTPDSVFSDSFV